MSARGAKKTEGVGKDSYPVGDRSKGQVHEGKVNGSSQRLMLSNSIFVSSQQREVI